MERVSLPTNSFVNQSDVLQRVFSCNKEVLNELFKTRISKEEKKELNKFKATLNFEKYITLTEKDLVKVEDKAYKDESSNDILKSSEENNKQDVVFEDESNKKLEDALNSLF